MSKSGAESNAINNKAKKFVPSKPKKEPIAVSYRLEGKHLGKGAFYDHYTLQSHTGFPTAVARSQDPAIKGKYLGDYISGQTLNMPHAPMDAKQKRPIPLELGSYQDGGLLFIPGMTRDSYEKEPSTHKIRMAFEKDALKDALRRGRPVLAVCAGTWTLWKALGGKLKSVSDHNYGAGMPRIGAKGTMTHNKHVHDVEVAPKTLLHDMMELGDTVSSRTLPANSVHWMAPDNSKVPNNFEVAAVAKQSDGVSILTRQQTEMAPDEDTVEGFSSKFGAPVAGFVWHLEAFDWFSKKPADVANNKALLFMAKAGSAFRAKQNMLDEYKDTVLSASKDEMGALSGVFSKMKL